MATLRALLISLILCSTVWAQGHTAVVSTPLAYVAPGNSVDLRAGMTKKDKTIKKLEPGTQLKVLKMNAKPGFSRVQLESGEIGWIPSSSLSSQPPAHENQADQIKTITAPGKSAEQLQTEFNSLQTELIAIRQASANVLRIQAERDQLQESVISLRRELETTQREKNALNDDQKQAWFLIGGSVLLGGIVLGLILPRLSVKRKSHWSSF